MLGISAPALWHHRGDVLRESKDLFVLGLLAIWLAGALLYVGARTTSATNISVIYAAAPVLIMVLSVFFYGERLGKVQAAGVALAFAGVLVIIFRGDVTAAIDLEFTAGDLWVLLAAIGWALYSVLLRYRPTRLSPHVRLAATAAAGLLVLLPMVVIEAIHVGLPPLEVRAFVAAAILGLLPGFAAFQAHAWLSREIGSTRTGLIFYLAPAYTAVLATIVLGERIAVYHISGALLVFIGVFLAARRGTAQER